MENNENKNAKYLKAANTSSVMMVLFLSAVFVFEAWQAGSEFNSILAALSILLALVIIVTTIKGTQEYSLLGFLFPSSCFYFTRR